MNPRSTALEASTVTITPPMNSRSTALEASTVTITPPMWSYLNTRSEENYEVRYYNEHNVSMDKKLLLYIQQLFNFVSIETLDNIIGDSFLSCYHITL